MDVDDSSSTQAAAASHSSAAFMLTEPQPSILTAALTAHFTALSAQSPLQHLHSIQRSTSAATGSLHEQIPVPLYRWTTTNAHKRQKRQQQPGTSLSSSTTPPHSSVDQPVVEHVLAFHTASTISLPLLSFVLAQLRGSLLVALVDSGQSVTVLRAQDGIVAHPSHGQLKKKNTAVARAAAPPAVAVAIPPAGATTQVTRCQDR